MISQELQLAQQQRINTYMRRSLHMLHMNSLNLYEEISQFAQNNPALVIPDDWQDWPEIYGISKSASASYTYSPSLPAMDIAAQKITLQEHLRQQWQNECTHKNDYLIGEKIISNLDYHGFHKIPPGDLFSQDITTDHWQKIMQKIQILDPLGCATDDCFESLLIQMRNDGFGAKLTPEDVKNGLQAWDEHYKEKSARAFDCHSIEELEILMSYMKGYTPYPGSAFYDHSPTLYIQPEFRVQWHQGRLILQEYFPFTKNLKIDSAYQSLSKQKNEQGRYAREYITQAKEFLKILEERESTLKRIVSLVCRYQKDFFLKGPRALKPLRQKDIAQQIHMHEATVSRAISGKYLDTPLGLIRLNTLFSSSIPHHTSNISKTALKAIIQDYLRDSKNTLSDQKICDQLNAQGYKIARRTVTKYRNELEKT